MSEDELRDPLSSIVGRIHSDPYTMENRLVQKLLRRLAGGLDVDEFRLTEIFTFGPATLVILSALIDDFESGRFDRAALCAALDSAGYQPDVHSDGA